ncbi:MAG TPA: RIO1 family regulatory kinase/ATPase [Micromonosporaceae bacterium]|nr:RIO1 family regulatory kinase/ATPase [Micromonosporaceae bacterium]
MRDFAPIRRQRRRFDDETPHDDDLRRSRANEPDTFDQSTDGLKFGDRWSTWDASAAGERGPKPYPEWLVTELAAVDTDLGVLKTGKEADVHLLERAVPDTGPSCLLASKRYRDPEHRMFHRDAGYLEGRRVRRSREMRAMTNRTSFGRQLIAGQWALTEFGALYRLYEAGVPVPYPVQILGTELLLEFVGDPDGVAAPRLAQVRAGADFPDLWQQLVDALVTMARLGLAHGDLSPYNLLVHDGRLVVIDLPQVVDVVANPRGASFLERDAAVVATWFAARGVPGTDVLPDLLLREAGLR